MRWDPGSGWRRMLSPILNVLARVSGRNWFWYFDPAGDRHLWFGRSGGLR